MEEKDLLVAKATRLFTFLAKSQRLKERPVRDVENYKRAGMLRWFSELPVHPAVRWDGPEADADAPVLTIDRVGKAEPPELPAGIAKWVSGSIVECDSRPVLRVHDSQVDLPAEVRDQELSPEQIDEIQPRFEQWIASWDEWAAEEKRAAPVRETYKDLYSAHVTASQNAEENELILAAGLLNWDRAGFERVRRHIFTIKAEIHVDPRSGQLEVKVDSEALGLTAELDMLDPAVFPTREVPAETEARARQYSDSAMDRVAFRDLGSVTIYALDPEGQYADDENPLRAGTSPTISWSPALILRPRPRVGMAQAFEKIAADIDESETVPSGLRPLLDPGEAPSTQRDPSPGALLSVDEEVFSPLPLNAVQRTVLERVDRHAQTLVQGPPGTGKTHTAAALLAHLLAQGKRVLVTAHTDRALYEVRNKLPELIRPLAVSVIGADRSDMNQLRTAVDTIAKNASEHDPDYTNGLISKTLVDVDALRSERQMLNEKLIDSREREIRTHEVNGYQGTLAAISQRYATDRAHYGWIDEFTDQHLNNAEAPSDRVAEEWLGYLRNTRLAQLSEHIRKRSPDMTRLPSPEQYASLLDALQVAQFKSREFSEVANHRAHEKLRQMDARHREELQSRLRSAVDGIAEASRLHAQWVDSAIQDIRRKSAQVWADRYRDLKAQFEYLEPRVNFLGYNTRIEYQGDPDANFQYAVVLRAHVQAGNEIKTQTDGSVKFGIFSPSIVKKCRPFLENVRVNGCAPVTTDLIDRYRAYQESIWALERMDLSWPVGIEIPQEDTLKERFSWHQSQIHMLGRVLEVRLLLKDVDDFISKNNLPTVGWEELPQVSEYSAVVDAVAAEEQYAAADEPLQSLRSKLDGAARWPDAADWVEPMRSAMQARDHLAYARAYRRATELAEAEREVTRLEQLTEMMSGLSDSLVHAVRRDPANTEWVARLAHLKDAWAWARTGEWLRGQKGLDANRLQEQISDIETRIQGAAEAIAAMRAWNHAVGEDRLSLGSRADLTQYSQLVRKLGKGTGKYAAQQRAEIRESLERCRPSVPVWIMPIYRVVEQLRISENMFDVVLIDEASQAGLEASFLQYLAPKIVVIGDDKQVSPAAVGVDQQALRDLADQYLQDDRYKASWQDPARSLFDEALMRYGGQLTLTEHRRCVPEIIGFSNRIAYEPNGIRLVPVRQFGADRLEPFKITRTASAYEEGRSGSKINRGEAQALVEAVLECLNDPAYDGRTFGVIGLLGTAQSKYIESLLLDAIPADVWEERQLQVGTPPDFQGSERDVIFLTMVSSLEPGTRLAPLTREMYVQRYNVAVSRAKDQVWLFHTLQTQDLTNEQDLRFQLLDYAYGVRRRGRDLDIEESPVVPENERVEGFDSLFEQRVYNRIVDRGFTVVPQFDTQGYRIDLVVVGANGRLAIECDGDHWHGPDAYVADLRRQRDLERCGWSFFRVRESTFYSNKATALSPLWELLEELEIYPSDFLDEVEHDSPPDADDLREATDDSAEWTAFEQLVSPDLPLPEGRFGETSEAAESFGPPLDPPAEEHTIGLAAEPSRGGAVPPPRPSQVPPTMVVNSPSSQPIVADQTSRADEHDGNAESKPLPSYVVYSGAIQPVSTASREEMVDGLDKIIAVEGPVTGERLLRSYVQASGGKRVGRAIAKELNSAVAQAVKSGQIIVDNPLNQSGVKPKTYRLPNQPPVSLRTLGIRTLEEVPPAEIASAMQLARSTYEAVSDEEILRYTLWLFGRKSLTQTVREFLMPIVDKMLRVEAE